jgi:hypothetical protein
MVRQQARDSRFTPQKITNFLLSFHISLATRSSFFRSDYTLTGRHRKEWQPVSHAVPPAG